MKKLLALALVLCLATPLCACSLLKRNNYQTDAPGTEPAETAPTATETAPESTETRPEEDGREALLALSQKALYDTLYAPALELWQVTEMGNYLWEINYGTQIQGPDGLTYYLLDDEEMTSLDALEKAYRAHFSQKLTRDLMGTDFIIEEDGRLWCLAVGKGGNIYYEGTTTLTLKDAGDTLTLTLTSTYILDMYFMAIEDYSNIPEEYLEQRSQDLTLVWEEGRWVFDSFCAPDLVGW